MFFYSLKIEPFNFASSQSCKICHLTNIALCFNQLVEEFFVKSCFTFSYVLSFVIWLTSNQRIFSQFVQFEINKPLPIFKAFEKFIFADLFRIAEEKSCDYLYKISASHFVLRNTAFQFVSILVSNKFLSVTTFVKPQLHPQKAL